MLAIICRLVNEYYKLIMDSFRYRRYPILSSQKDQGNCTINYPKFQLYRSFSCSLYLVSPTFDSIDPQSLFVRLLQVLLFYCRRYSLPHLRWFIQTCHLNGMHAYTTDIAHSYTQISFRQLLLSKCHNLS